MHVSKQVARITSTVAALGMMVLPVNNALAGHGVASGGQRSSAEPAEEEEPEGGEDEDDAEAGEEGDEAEGETGEEEDEEEEEEEDEEEEDESEEATTVDAAAAEGPQRPPEPKFGKNAATGRGMTIAGATLTGLGAALVGASIAFTRCNYGGALECRYGEQDTFFIPSAAAVTGIGLTLLFTGLAYRSKYKSWERWSPDKAEAMIAPSLVPGGAGLSVTGRF